MNPMLRTLALSLICGTVLLSGCAMQPERSFVPTAVPSAKRPAPNPFLMESPDNLYLLDRLKDTSPKPTTWHWKNGPGGTCSESWDSSGTSEKCVWILADDGKKDEPKPKK